MLPDLGGDLRAEPIADRGDSAGELPDAAAGRAYVIEVLAVAKRGWCNELVQAGAATEDQLVAQVIVVGDLHDQA